MPSQANPRQKTKRASLGRMLAQLTIGLGVCTGAALLAAPGFSQTCDRCAGISSPNCGCETAIAKPAGPKIHGCKCAPKPSLGEKILSHFEQVGDRLEAKAAKSVKAKCDPKPGSHSEPTCGCESPVGPTCGCESPQGPSCGCETCTTSKSMVRMPFQKSQLPPIVSQFKGDSGRFAAGSIGDKQLKETPSTPTSPAKVPSSKPIPQKPLVSAPAAPTVPAPSVQRVPFEQKPVSTPANRIPADETNQAVQTMPNTLKPVPSDRLPTRTASPNQTPAANPAAPAAKAPDVLVDPFKDDLSSRGTRDKMEVILLTSDRQVADNALRLVPAESEAPSRLTPKQRGTSTAPEFNGLQFEAAESDSVQGSQVVPSNYVELLPVKLDVRKEASNGNANGSPQVSKMRVPTKR